MCFWMTQDGAWRWTLSMRWSWTIQSCGWQRLQWPEFGARNPALMKLPVPLEAGWRRETLPLGWPAVTPRCLSCPAECSWPVPGSALKLIASEPVKPAAASCSELCGRKGEVLKGEASSAYLSLSPLGWPETGADLSPHLAVTVCWWNWSYCPESPSSPCLWWQGQRRRSCLWRWGRPKC